MDARDQTLKQDAGKSRLDLFPFDTVDVVDYAYPLAQMADSLTKWWYIAPVPLQSFVPRRILLDVGKVLAFGATKYSPRGWEKGIPFSRLFAAAIRHATLALNGETNDPETGLPHEAHFYCNIAFIVALTARHGDEFDDRPPASEKLAAIYARMQQFVGLGQAPESSLPAKDRN